jgi:hypothetical protein
MGDRYFSLGRRPSGLSLTPPPSQKKKEEEEEERKGFLLLPNTFSYCSAAVFVGLTSAKEAFLAKLEIV